MTQLIPTHSNSKGRAAAPIAAAVLTAARSAFLAVRAAVLVSIAAAPCFADTIPSSDLPSYLRDRGPGVSTSLFGTYVEKGELLVYPFYEYTLNKDAEYTPEELGYVGTSDFRGKLTEHEALIFLSYGVSDKLAFELESAVYTSATQHKSPSDPSAMPSSVSESGFGDTQAEIRWRLSGETEGSPEIWSYTEITFPFQKSRRLIGTSNWELIQGFGLTKGFSWGTTSLRASALYSEEEGAVEFGEYAFEYLKRFSDKWRGYVGVEGEQDEVALIAEVQWRLSPRATLKLNNGFGLTNKAPDQAPEIGIALSF
jgi:hypothetical protein